VFLFSTRELDLAAKYAERIVDASSRHDPGFLLTLAEAYRAAGQPARTNPGKRGASTAPG